MIEIPPFFVPFVAAADYERVYEDLARHCGARPLPPGERLYAITFTHHSDTWTATVGQRLGGEKIITRKVRGERIERVQHLYDNATVLAIFPGHPYLVIHDNNRSQWDNPFYAGGVRGVRTFPAG
ncbi:MAG: hypothetical protein KF910_06905 [Brevundimonas sp.]|uniref:hypothetical protein n=1 Tax=Brevundimonas sp. TaxID=1871086 RepID=UPI0025C6EF7A|nr:hypothetical protein [Brevundimonas sp.]MBX3477318.1 hypothetical protein [Brevundimonas sp.]